MITVSIHDAKTNLSKYIAAAKRGEKVYIGNRGKPEVRIVAETPPKIHRKFGVLKKELSGYNFDYDDHEDPEWQEMIRQMYEKPIFPDEK